MNAQKLRSRNVNTNPVQHKSKLYDDIKNAKRKKKNEQNVKSGFSKTSWMCVLKSNEMWN